MAYVRVMLATVREMLEIFVAQLRLERARRDHEGRGDFL
jgi:hypothetical protein